MTRAEVEQQAVDLREEGINYAADMLLSLLEAKESHEKRANDNYASWALLIVERDALRAEVARLQRALERIHGMSERPVCICGVPTGTGAIKASAAAALTGTAPLAGDDTDHKAQK